MKDKLNFSQEWDTAYREHTHQSKWPWSDLVSLIYTTIDCKNKDLKVLELGCGYGANIPFFNSLDVDYYAVDGSDYIVEDIIKRFPKLKTKVNSVDFTKQIPFDEKFDLIVDRAALTHNDTIALKETISLIKEKLNDGGIYIGVDWFSDKHSEFKNGDNIENDIFTKTNYKNGPFQDLGKVHYSSYDHLKELFKDFEFLSLEHKNNKTIIPKDSLTSGCWNFVLKYNKKDS